MEPTTNEGLRSIFTYYIKIVLSTVKCNTNLYIVTETCVILVTLYAVTAIIFEKGCLHCTVFLFFAEHRVTSGFASDVNTNS